MKTARMFTRRTMLPLFATLPWLARAANDEKPMQIIVPFAPGGSGDISARMLADALTRKTGRTVVVDNRPGANGIIGTRAVRGGPTDGSMLLLATTSTHLANPSLFRKLPYDPNTDFQLVGSFGTGSTYLLVRPDAPYQTLDDLIQFARQHPGELHYDHFNATSNVSAAVLASVAGVSMTAVPYKQVGQAMTELISGQIQLVFTDTVQGDALVSSGRLRPLAVQSSQRLKRYPEIPLVRESLPAFGVVGAGFLGIAIPAGTPITIAQNLNDLINDIVTTDPVKSRLEGFGFVPSRLSLADLEDFARREQANWRKYVEIANLEVQ